MDESNILELHHLADLYGLQQLKEKVRSFILSNIQTLSRTDVYRQLPQDEVFRALSSDELQVNSENEVYEAALHYHYSPEQVETDQVYLQVSPKVCLHFMLIYPSKNADIIYILLKLYVSELHLSFISVFLTPRTISRCLRLCVFA